MPPYSHGLGSKPQGLRLVLGNAAYRKLDGICLGHMTSEQAQLQDGLVHNGWVIAGRHMDMYADKYLPAGVLALNETRVDTLLRKVRPHAVFINDPRDMQAESGGCFDKWTNFENIEELRQYPGFKVVSFKDAAVAIDYQRDFAAKVGANALATYYHADSIRVTSPWADNYRQIRHYHCVDSDYIKSLNLYKDRQRGLVSGHTSVAFYPLRNEITKHAPYLKIDVQHHPGWNNHGCKVPEYLELLTNYKVHVATATKFGHALRKIIESICCGCACVTNLPTHDKLPVIDDWLIRLPEKPKMDDVKSAIDKAEAEWDCATAVMRAQEACHYYDYKTDAARLSTAIYEASEARA